MPSPDTVHGVRAALPFVGPARAAVVALKYHNRREVAGVLARLVLHRTLPGAVDLVTWAPTSGAHERRRGVDQSFLLARSIARELGVPCRRLLYRTHGPAQTGRRRAERLADGPGFRGRPAESVPARPGLRVLLVDDVVTTGATLAAAREALLAAGVAEVVAIAVAAPLDRRFGGGPHDTQALRRMALTPAGGPRR